MLLYIEMSGIGIILLLSGGGGMKKDKVGTQTTKPGKTQFSVETIALVSALGLSMLGISITDYAPLQSYRYWGVMTLALAAAGIAIGWSRAKRASLPIRKTLTTQLVHWLTTVIAISGVYLLLKAGRLNFENTGLVLLMTLGFSTFLDGYRISWRFSLIGVLMFVTGIAAAYVEEYLWVLLIITAAVATALFYWERHQTSRRHQAEGPAQN